MAYPPSITLGTILRALPDSFRTGHDLTDIHAAFEFGFANRLWTKREAARAAFKAHSELNVARGSGNRAKLRIAARSFQT